MKPLEPGIYVTDPHIPEYLWSSDIKALKTYLINYENLQIIYSCNLTFVEELQTLMKNLNIKSTIHSFNNLGCKYKLVFEIEQEKVVSEKMKTKIKLASKVVVGDVIYNIFAFNKKLEVKSVEESSCGKFIIFNKEDFNTYSAYRDYELIVEDKSNRPSWDEYFLGFAKWAAVRSLDSQTKHGCVIVKNNKIIGTGYNSFARGMDDDSLPNTRPDKYRWMIHSELNAILNCTCPPIDACAYVTGQCCLNCLMAMWQAGITTVKQLDNNVAIMIDEKMMSDIRLFLSQTGMKSELIKE